MLSFNSVVGRKLLFFLNLMHIFNAIFFSCCFSPWLSFFYLALFLSHIAQPFTQCKPTQHSFWFQTFFFLYCVTFPYNPTQHWVYLQVWSFMRTSVRTSLSERWVDWAMLVTWQCLVTHSFSSIHRFVHSLGTLTPDRNTYCAIYSNTYAAKYLPFNSWQTFSFQCGLVWVLLA